MKTNLSRLTFLSLLCIARLVSATEPSPELRKQWKEALIPCLADVKYAVVIELPETFNSQVPNLKAPIGPMEVWRRYACMNDRELLQTKNGLLVKSKEQTFYDSFFRLAEHFAKLSAKDLRQIGATGIEITQLPQEIQESLASNWARYPGVAERYLNGDPVFVRLIEVPVAIATDSRELETLGQFGNRFSDFLKVSQSSGAAVKPTPIPLKEGFFLGDGLVVTVSELANRIRRELGVRLLFDLRLRDCLLYVQGYLPKSQILTMMKALVETQKMVVEDVVPMSATTFDKIMQAIDSTTDMNEWKHMDVSRELLKKRGEYSRDDLLQLSPYLNAISKKQMGDTGLTRAETRYTLDMILGITFTAKPPDDPKKFANQSDGKFFVKRPVGKN